MFCKNCGNKLMEDAKFCANCGNNTIEVENTIISEVKTVDDKEIKLIVKPTFKLIYMGFRKFSLIFIITILLIVVVAMGLSLEKLGIYWLFIAIIIIVNGGKILSEMVQYKHTEYNFYNTKVVYRDGFLNKMEKEVKYKYVREVVLRQDFFQRLFKLGTIVLYTNAESVSSGISILNITNSEEVYKKIKEIAKI